MGELLQRYRMDAGLTQSEAALSVGLSLRTLQRIESGEYDVRCSQKDRLIKLYGRSDLEMVLDMMEQRDTSPNDVAAVARLLPADIRREVTELMLAIAKAVGRIG